MESCGVVSCGLWSSRHMYRTKDEKSLVELQGVGDLDIIFDGIDVTNTS